MMDRKKIIIDLDSDFDNLIAVSYLLASDDVEILGISTVHGFMSELKAASNVQMLLSACGRKVPLAAGASMPVMRMRMSGTARDDGFELDRASLEPGTAWDMIHGLLQSAGTPVTVLLLGAATNIANLLHKYPEDADRIGRLIFCGGSYAEGTITPSACHKVYFDAEAMQYIMHKGLSFHMLPLDVTSGFENQLTDRAFLDSVSCKALEKVSGILKSSNRANDKIRAPYAAVAVTNPELFEYDSYKCEVELNGKCTYGMTVVYTNDYEGMEELEDGTKVRRTVKDKDRNIRYARPFDNGRVLEIVRDALGRL